MIIFSYNFMKKENEIFIKLPERNTYVNNCESTNVNKNSNMFDSLKIKLNTFKENIKAKTNIVKTLFKKNFSDFIE
jgi:hypothetical protein